MPLLCSQNDFYTNRTKIGEIIQACLIHFIAQNMISSAKRHAEYFTIVYSMFLVRTNEETFKIIENVFHNET